MPVCEQTVRCTKCDSSFDLRMMQRRKTYSCLLCGEPIQDAIDADRATWAEEDFREEGKK